MMLLLLMQLLLLLIMMMLMNFVLPMQPPIVRFLGCWQNKSIPDIGIPQGLHRFSATCMVGTQLIFCAT